MTPRIGGLADTSLSSGELWVQGSTRGGEAIIEGFADDNYMVQVGADLALYEAMVWVRHTDGNNGYRFRFFLDPPGYTVHLHSFEDGESDYLTYGKYTPSGDLAIKIKLDGTSIKWPALDSPQWSTR